MHCKPDSGEEGRSSRFDLRDPSRPGLVGDKPQSGEPSVTASPLLLRFFFGVTTAVCAARSNRRR